MLSTVFGLFTKVGAWVGAVEGAHFIVDKAKDYSRSDRIATAAPVVPIVVAGIGDTITTVLDPLDLTGTRKRKEDAQKAREQGLRESVKEQKERLKREQKAKEEQVKRARAAEKKLADAQRKAAEQERKIEKLAREGRTSEAKRLADQQRFGQRWQALAERTRQESEALKNKDPEKASTLASAALEIAKLAINPPANAIEAINSEATDAGKSLIASLVDSVNRAGDPDIENLFQRMSNGDPSAYGDAAALAWDSDVEGSDKPHVAGAGCCNAKGKPACGACKSGKACPSTVEVPAAFVSGDGDFDAETFGDFEAYMSGEEISGSEDFGEFMSGGCSDDYEPAATGCASGRCAIAASQGAYEDW